MSATIEGTGTELLRLWSVTTLIKMALGVGQPLVNWNCEQTAVAAVDKRATLDAMLAESGREETIKWLVKERWNVIERHQIRGTDVHRAAEAIALGIEPTIVPGTEAYVEQLRRWQQKWKPEYLLAEAPVYNATHAYAGTLDGIMRVGGRSLLFDYKTTPKGPDARSRPPYPEVALQMTAYANAESVGVLSEQRYDGFRQRYYLYDPSVEHASLPPIDGAICIVVSPVDCYAVTVSIGPKVWDAWRHVLALAAWNDEGTKHVFGATLDNSIPAVAAA